MRIKIGNIIADENEFLPYEEGMKAYDEYNCFTQNKNKRVTAKLKSENREIELVTVCCGIGKAAAASAAAYLIAEGCGHIINSGLSGGISKVRINDIVVGEEYQMTDFDLSAIGYKKGYLCDCESIFHANSDLLDMFKASFPKAMMGKFGTNDAFISDREIKHSLRDENNITACDMESAAIAYVCYKADVPFLSFRKISDNADDAAYAAYFEMASEAEEKLFEITINLLKEMLKSENIFIKNCEK